MANAKKCDRCGKFYELYNIANDDVKPNCVAAVNCDFKGIYTKDIMYDLCPECMTEFKKWMGWRIKNE